MALLLAIYEVQNEEETVDSSSLGLRLSSPAFPPSHLSQSSPYLFQPPSLALVL